MSLHLEFEPHSWYMGFAIAPRDNSGKGFAWVGYTDNGNTYHVDEIHASTLKTLEYDIREYWLRQSGGNADKLPAYYKRYLLQHHVRENIPF